MDGLVHGQTDADLEAVFGEAVRVAQSGQARLSLEQIALGDRDLEAAHLARIRLGLRLGEQELERLDPALLVLDRCKLLEQADVVARDRHEQLPAEPLECPGGVHNVALGLDQPLARNRPRATQQREIAREHDLARLCVPIRRARPQILRGVQDPARSHLPAPLELFGDTKLVQDREHRGELPLVARTADLDRGCVEQSRVESVTLDEQRDRRQDVVLLGAQKLPALALADPQGLGERELHGLGRLLGEVAVEPGLRVAGLIGGCVLEILGRGVLGGDGLRRLPPLVGLGVARTPDGGGGDERAQLVRPLREHFVDPPIDATHPDHTSRWDSQNQGQSPNINLVLSQTNAPKMVELRAPRLGYLIP